MGAVTMSECEGITQLKAQRETKTTAVPMQQCTNDGWLSFPDLLQPGYRDMSEKTWLAIKQLLRVRLGWGLAVANDPARTGKLYAAAFSWCVQSLTDTPCCFALHVLAASSHGWIQHSLPSSFSPFIFLSDYYLRRLPHANVNMFFVCWTRQLKLPQFQHARECGVRKEPLTHTVVPCIACCVQRVECLFRFSRNSSSQFVESSKINIRAVHYITAVCGGLKWRSVSSLQKRFKQSDSHSNGILHLRKSPAEVSKWATAACSFPQGPRKNVKSFAALLAADGYPVSRQRKKKRKNKVAQVKKKKKGTKYHLFNSVRTLLTAAHLEVKGDGLGAKVFT